MSTTHTPDLDPVLVEDAVKALIKYERKRSSEGGTGKAKLIDDLPKYIFVQIQLKKPVAQKVQKPIRVKIPHSLFNAEDEDHSLCLFCRTEDKENIEKYLETSPITGLKKVMSMSEVKKHLKDFKARKALLSEHTHFLCHAAIARQLYNALGKDFASRNAFPVQCSFDAPTQLPTVIAKAVSASYLHLAGTNLVFPLGKLSLSVAENAENVLQGARFAINEKVTNGWSAVHSVYLKTKDSAALPVFTCIEGDKMMDFVKKTSAASKAVAAPPAAAVAAAAEPAAAGKKAQKKRQREEPAAAAAPAAAVVVEEPAVVVQEEEKKNKKAKKAVPAPVPVPVKETETVKEKEEVKAVAAKKKKVVKK